MPTKSTEKKPTYKDPLRATNDIDPIKTRIKTPKPYEDPLRIRPKTFKPEPYKFEYKPYNSYHEYKPSNIDPLTGRPYRARRRQYKDEPKEEKNEDPELDEWQTVLTQMRRRGTRRLIWVYAVCLCLSVQNPGVKYNICDMSKQLYMSEFTGKCSAYGQTTENKENNGTAVSTDASEKSESEAKEPRYILPFCIVYGIGALFSTSIATYMPSQVTMVERTLGLSSSESGLLLSANDVGFVVTIIIASHFLHRSHIPRVLSICVFVFGLACIVTGITHFFMDEKLPTQDPSSANSSAKENSNYICLEATDNLTTMFSPKALQNGGNCDKNGEGSTESYADRKWVFGYMIFWMIIMGIVKAPRNPLSATYVDNNARKERTAFYLAIVHTLFSVGPMIAITAGGVFSKMPVDLKDTSLTPEDPRWVGAWWLGFLVFGACAILSSLPIFCFPAGPKKPLFNKNNRFSESLSSDTNISFCGYLKDLPKSVFRVIRCPVYTLCIIAAMLQFYGAMSLMAFGPKYMESQFNIPSWKANTILGIEKLVAGVFGILGGGLIARKLKLDIMGCCKLLVIARSTTLVMNCFFFLFGCNNPPMVGLDTADRLNTSLTCDCSGTNYMLVCADGQTFFSPCYAGCQLQTETEFSQCLGSTSGDVTKGFCDPGCDYLIPFVIMDCLSALIDSLVIAPYFFILLRSVRERDRSMAMALTSFLISLCVLLPAPIIYGKLFDSLCLSWKSNCGVTGSCSLYDAGDMRVKLNSANVGVRFACVSCTLAMLYFARRLWIGKPPRYEETPESEDRFEKKESISHDENSKGHGIMQTPM